MKQRCGKWLADWRDASGARHRKAFKRKTDAQRHQRRMNKTATEKKARASTQSPKSHGRGPRPSRSRARAA